MMKNVLKQCIGIDCSKDELVCCFGFLNEDLIGQVRSRRTFSNTISGFNELLNWSEKQAKGEQLFFVIESTSVYHENITRHLFTHNQRVAVILPNKINYFTKSLDIKTATDKTAAEAIMLYGLQAKLRFWEHPNNFFVEVRSLTREREAMIDELTCLKNQLHAIDHGAASMLSTKARLNERVELIEQQIIELENELKALIKSNRTVHERMKKVMTIKGVGLITAATILGETFGFALITSRRQLVSYSGLDVIEKTSGTSVRGKKRISKRGNRHIRKALYFPALTAVKHDETMKNSYQRLVSKHGIKMKGAVAIQRKLLELIFTIWKNESIYDEKYHEKKSGQPSLVAPTRLE